MVQNVSALLNQGSDFVEKMVELGLIEVMATRLGNHVDNNFESTYIWGRLLADSTH